MVTLAATTNVALSDYAHDNGCLGDFLLSYFGVAVGGPRWALDRTGIGLLGAIAMVATGVLSVHEAVQAVDVPTILLLYALMIISAQLRLGGFYT